MFAWSRTFYAKRNGVYFNFEAKKDRDHAVRCYGFEPVTSTEAYGHPRIKVGWREYKRITSGKGAIL